ncbi:hypothetical protein ADUPG1_014865 [Aduncisulcus paluster]|uniref:Uncharacterized protein n=1 Tax=Aduncisulcus paluster TaxID=2918883 RepID=A0ABQ5KBR3_9EUKA|nr:hypothetical protein ADUPG1_014865 [Aduncisulcus paluster]
MIISEFKVNIWYKIKSSSCKPIGGEKGKRNDIPIVISSDDNYKERLWSYIPNEWLPDNFFEVPGLKSYQTLKRGFIGLYTHGNSSTRQDFLDIDKKQIIRWNKRLVRMDVLRSGFERSSSSKATDSQSAISSADITSASQDPCIQPSIPSSSSSSSFRTVLDNEYLCLY